MEDTPLHRYQVLPPWDREYNKDLEEAGYKGDELSALMLHLNQIKRLSWKFLAGADCYDVLIFTEEAHNLFLRWHEKYAAPIGKTTLVKGRLDTIGVSR